MAARYGPKMILNIPRTASIAVRHNYCNYLYFRANEKKLLDDIFSQCGNGLDKKEGGRVKLYPLHSTRSHGTKLGKQTSLFCCRWFWLLIPPPLYLLLDRNKKTNGLWRLNVRLQLKDGWKGKQSPPKKERCFF